MRDSLWDFNRFSLGKPCQKRLLSKRQLLMLIDLNMNPSPQGGFIVAQDRSFLKPRRSGKSGTSQIVSFEHAKASAALAASCKRACGKSSNEPTSGLISISSLISHGALMSIGSPSGSSSGCSGSFLSLGRETIKYSWHSLFRKSYTRDRKSPGAQGRI